MKAKNLILLTSIFVLASACAHSRVVQEVPGSSGVVAIKTRNHKASREKAKLYMAENCQPKTYRIIEEGEKIKGEMISADTYGRVHRDSKKEWLIKYRCKN